jgi:hypothetical protein
MKVIYKNIKTGQTSNQLLDVLEENVFVNFAWFDGADWKSTPFRDVVVVPWEDIIPAESKSIMKVLRNIKMTRTKFIQLFIKSLRVYMAECLKKYADKKKILFVSSGYDSRLVAWLIKDLGYQDQVKFICYGREWKGFKRVANYLKLEDCVLVKDPYKYEPTYEQVLDFKTIWEKTGISDYPYNPWWTILDRIKPGQVGRVQDTVIFISQYNNGWYLFYNSTPIKKNLFNKLMNIYYYSAYARYAGVLDYPLIFPIFNSKTAMLLSSAKVEFKSKQFSTQVLEQIDPKLAAFPNCGAYQTERNILKVDKAKMVRDFKKSEYYKMHKIDLNKVHGEVVVNNWWRHYTGASFIQNLIACGYNVGELK